MKKILKRIMCIIFSILLLILNVAAANKIDCSHCEDGHIFISHECPKTEKYQKDCDFCGAVGTITLPSVKCTNTGCEGGIIPLPKLDCPTCENGLIIKPPVKCNACGGKGDSTTTTACPKTETVSKYCNSCDRDGEVYESDMCYGCYGSGSISSSCGSCGGSGGKTIKIRCGSCSACYSSSYGCLYPSYETVSCGSCGGSGETSRRCNSCGGSGSDGYWRKCYNCGGDKYYEVSQTCSICNGSGSRVVVVNCPNCDNGYVVPPPIKCTNDKCQGGTIPQEPLDCPTCVNGWIPQEPIDCSSCEGGQVEAERPCSICNGEGIRIEKTTCGICNGQGYLLIDEIADPIINDFDKIVLPIIFALMTIAVLPSLIKRLIEYAKTDDVDKRSKLKKEILTSCVATLSIAVLVVVFRLSYPILSEWVKSWV